MGTNCCCNTDETEQIRKARSVKFPIATMQRIEDETYYRQKVEKIWVDYYKGQGNGNLNKEEAKTFLRDIMTELTGKEPTEDELERKFKHVDKNGNGEINKEEAFIFLKGFHLDCKLKSLMGDSQAIIQQ